MLCHGAWGQGHGEGTPTFRLTRHSLEASPRARRASGPDAFVLSARGPRYPARLRGTLIFSAGHRTGAAASEADELLGPRLVVLSVSRGDANAIRVPGTTEVGRQGEGGGRDPAVSRDEVSRAVAGPLPTQRDACLPGARWGWGTGDALGADRPARSVPFPPGLLCQGSAELGSASPRRRGPRRSRTLQVHGALLWPQKRAGLTSARCSHPSLETDGLAEPRLAPGCLPTNLFTAGRHGRERPHAECSDSHMPGACVTQRSSKHPRGALVRPDRASPHLLPQVSGGLGLEPAEPGSGTPALTPVAPGHSGGCVVVSRQVRQTLRSPAGHQRHDATQQPRDGHGDAVL